MLRSNCLLVLLTIAVLCFNSATAAENAATKNWSSWRGPRSHGSIDDAKLPTKFSSEHHVAWKVKLPGIGCSTPVVWQEHILVTAPIDGDDALIALGHDGNVLWQTAIGPERAGKHRNGSGSNPSPATDGETIFVYFKSGNLAAVDFHGKLLWKTNLQTRFAKDTLFWDLGTSPVVTDSGVVVAVMHNGESFLVAFDKKSGDLQWKVARNYQTPNEGDHSYATPIVIDHEGEQRLIVWGAEHVTGHDLKTGEQLWACGGFNPDAKRNWVVVASHVVVGDVAVVPYGRGTHLAGVQLGGEGEVTDTHRVWTRDDTGTFVPTPAVYNGKVYLVRDSGEVLCLDPKTGKTLWEDRFPKNRNKYYASPLIAGGNLYAPREDGVVLVANITDGFQFVSENDMQQRVIASPVPLGKNLLIRGEEHLFCLSPEG